MLLRLETTPDREVRGCVEANAPVDYSVFARETAQVRPWALMDLRERADVNGTAFSCRPIAGWLRPEGVLWIVSPSLSWFLGEESAFEWFIEDCGLFFPGHDGSQTEAFWAGPYQKRNLPYAFTLEDYLSHDLTPSLA